MFQAAHAYIARWRATRCPTTMTPAWLEVSKGLVKTDVFDYASDMAAYGFRPHGPSAPVRFHRRAYASVNDDPATTASELWGDLVTGRLFVFTEASERHTANLMESKLTFVTQADVANPEIEQTRYISDPRLEVNERVTSENHPTCVIPRHQNVARRLMY